MKLDRQQTALVIVDVQERLMPVIHSRHEVQQNIERLVRGVHILGIPLLVTEQYVKGLGSTVGPIRSALEETGAYHPIEKDCFSAFGCQPFNETLRSLDRKQIVIAGVETHVCVYQTSRDLVGSGYEVTIVADAVSSRTEENRRIALQRLASEGVSLSSTEMVLFELLVASGTDEFRAIAKLVK